MKTIKQVLATAAFCTSVACNHLADADTLQNIYKTGKVYTYESDATGFNTKTFFYDNGSEVVAFDAQFTPELATQAIAYLRQQTKSPLRYLIVTHPNPDKFNGIDVFKQAGATVIASSATAEALPGVHAYKKYYFVSLAKMFTEANYPKLGQIDQTFQGTFELRLAAGDVIKLTELAGPGASTTQTVAFIPSVNALIVGDLVHHKAHAWLEGGIVSGKATPTLSSWIKDLEQIGALYRDANPTVLGGRGNAAPLNDVVPEQITYLKTADQTVGAYVQSLGARKVELSGEQANQHWLALKELMEKAFPNYSLSYMIQYGVYGLASMK